MKLQRVFVLGLATALILLSGCGAKQRFDIVDPTTTEATTITTAEITTTEAPTTTTEAPTAPPTTAPGFELHQRVLDLDDKANAELKSRLEEFGAENRKSEYPMGNGKTVVGNYDGLFLRDDKTGKETLLLEAKWDDPSEEHNESPYVERQLDDRYFIYIIQGWEWHAGAGIYDTKRMKAIPIKVPAGAESPEYGYHRPTSGNVLYVHDPFTTSVYRIDLSKLHKAEYLPLGENLLKDVPEARTEDLLDVYNSAEFSPDGQYCAVVLRYTLTNGVVAVFDLHKKVFLFQMELPDAVKHCQRFAFDDSNTLYLYDTYGTLKVLEIKLP